MNYQILRISRLKTELENLSVELVLVEPLVTEIEAVHLITHLRSVEGREEVREAESGVRVVLEEIVCAVVDVDRELELLVVQLLAVLLGHFVLMLHHLLDAVELHRVEHRVARQSSRLRGGSAGGARQLSTPRFPARGSEVFLRRVRVAASAPRVCVFACLCDDVSSGGDRF